MSKKISGVNPNTNGYEGEIDKKEERLNEIPLVEELTDFDSDIPSSLKMPNMMGLGENVGLPGPSDNAGLYYRPYQYQSFLAKEAHLPPKYQAASSAISYISWNSGSNQSNNNGHNPPRNFE